MNWQLSIFWLHDVVVNVVLMNKDYSNALCCPVKRKLVIFHTVTQIHFILLTESTININTAKIKINKKKKNPKHSLACIGYHTLAPFPDPYMNMHNCLNSNFANMLKQTYPTTVFINCLWLVRILN